MIGLVVSSSILSLFSCLLHLQSFEACSFRTLHVIPHRSHFGPLWQISLHSPAHGPGDVDIGGFSTLTLLFVDSCSFFSGFEDVAFSFDLCLSSALCCSSGLLVFDFAAVMILGGGDTSFLLPVQVAFR